MNNLDVDPAPYLTEEGRCSDCRVKPTILASGDLKVCPRCYGVLWHPPRTESAERLAEIAADRLRIKAEREARRREREQLRKEERAKLNENRQLPTATDKDSQNG